MNKTLSARRQGLPVRSQLGRLIPRTFLDEMFDQFWTDSNGGQFSEAMNAAMDVAETDHAFEVKMDLPGVNADDVDIQIDNNTLTVREEYDPKNLKHRMKKNSFIALSDEAEALHSVVLPNSVNEEETIAEFKDGVLKITVAKADNAKPRKISIKT